MTVNVISTRDGQTIPSFGVIVNSIEELKASYAKFDLTVVDYTIIDANTAVPAGTPALADRGPASLCGSSICGPTGQAIASLSNAPAIAPTTSPGIAKATSGTTNLAGFSLIGWFKAHWLLLLIIIILISVLDNRKGRRG